MPELALTKAAAWVAAGAWILTVIVYHPGMMSPDSVDLLSQANKWTFSTTQPPVMALLWAIMNLIVKGPLPMLCLQAAAWWTGWCAVAAWVFPGTRWRQVAVVLVCGFWPPLFAMVGTIWRDVHMTLALLLATCLLVLADPERPGRNLWGAGILVAYASAVRVNALLSVIPFAGWLCVRAWKAMGARVRPRLRVALVALVAVAIVFGGRWLNWALASHHWAQTQNEYVFDLVGISARTGRNLLPPAIRNGFERPDQVAALYTAFTIYPIYFGPVVDGYISESRILTTEVPAQLSEIRRAWWSAVKANPGAYFAHRVAVFAANLGWNRLPLHYPYQMGVSPNSLGVEWTPTRASALAYGAFDVSLRHFSWLWRPWLFLWLSTLVAAAALAGIRDRGIAPATMVVLASGMLYTLPYFLVAPAADLRYHHWPIAASLLGFLLFRAETRGMHASKSVGRTTAAGGAFAAATVALAAAAGASRIDFGPAAPRPEVAVRDNADGLALMARGDFASAQRLFARAAHRDRFWHVPEINLGIALYATGKVDEARTHYDAAVRLDRTAVEARTFRGEFLIKERRWKEALDDFEAAIASGRDTYSNAKGAATAAAGSADAARALRHANRCQDLDPGRLAVDIVAIATPFFADADHAKAGVAFFLGLRQRLENAWWVHLNLAALAAKVGETALADESAARGAALKAAGR